MKLKKGFVIISGPSGVGKSTLIEKILINIAQLTCVISHTTRQKRPSEENGKDYFFISEEEFFKKKEQGQFVEWAHIYNHYSGISKEEVERVWSEGKVVIKDVDLQGFKSIKKIYPQSLGVGIFVTQEDEIKSRIDKRGGDQGQSLEMRLSSYSAIMKELKNLCSVSIFNDDLEQASDLLKKEIEKYLKFL